MVVSKESSGCFFNAMKQHEKICKPICNFLQGNWGGCLSDWVSSGEASFSGAQQSRPAAEFADVDCVEVWGLGGAG